MISPAGESPRIRREPSPAQNEPPRSGPLPRLTVSGAGPAPGWPSGSAGASFAALGRAGILVTGLASPVGSGAVTPTARRHGRLRQARRHASEPRDLRPARPRSYSWPWDDRSMNGTTGPAPVDVITGLG